MIIINNGRISSYQLDYKNKLKKLSLNKLNLFTDGQYVYKQVNFVVEKEVYNSFSYENT